MRGVAVDSMQKRRSGRGSGDDAVAPRCPWGPGGTTDASALPNAPLSSFVPLTYVPAQPAAAAKKSSSQAGLGRFSTAFRKVTGKLNRTSSTDSPDELAPPYGPLGAPPTHPPAVRPGWLNPYGVGAERDNSYGIAMPSDAATATIRFPAPDFAAPPPLPRSSAPEASGGNAASDTRCLMSDSNRPLIPDSNSNVLGGLSNFSVAQSTASIFAGGNATGGGTGGSASWFDARKSASLTLVHPIYLRQSAEYQQFGSMHSHARTVTADVGSEQSSAGAVSAPGASSTSINGTSYVPAAASGSTGAASTQGSSGISAHGSGRHTTVSYDLARGPSTIPEETTEEASEQLGALPREATFAPEWQQRVQVPSDANGAAVQEVLALLEAREAEAAVNEGAAAARAQVSALAQAIANTQVLGLPQKLLGQYWCASPGGVCTTALVLSASTHSQRRHAPYSVVEY